LNVTWLDDGDNGRRFAALLITTEAMVAEVPKKNAGAGGMPQGGGMGGMGGMDRPPRDSLASRWNFGHRPADAALPERKSLVMAKHSRGNHISWS
jgi:hypothetical protein